MTMRCYMVHPTRFIKMLLVFSLLSYNAQADDPLMPIKFTGHYDFAFSGIPFGQMDILLDQTATRYQATGDVKTTGIARILVQHESHSTSSGSGKDFHYGNAEYESRYATRGKKKYARISKKNGKIVSDKVEPLDNRAVRPAVPMTDKSAAVDPLAMSVAIRSEFARARKEDRKNFTLDFYDGRRLTRANFTIGDERVLRIGGQKIPVLALSARRKTLAGYTASELARINSKESELMIYFSHDAKFVPVYLEVPVAFGVATATLKM
jgi:hypothetical protein